MEFDDLSNAVIGAAIEVHRELGPGLLESVYEHCLAYELESRGLTISRQFILPIRYKGHQIEGNYRIDLLVQDQRVVELKCVEAINGIHAAQLLTYLKLAGKKTGLILNFNVERMKDGIRRFVL